MTTLFISYAQENADCAETIRRRLEAKGYTLFREPGYPGPGEISYSHMIENAILGSAAVVLVWSAAAAQAAWIEQHILFTQRLKKPLLPIVLDGSALPDSLIIDTVISGQPPCNDAISQLLPLLPQSGSTDPLLLVYEHAAHEFIRTRREAIDEATSMLQRGEYRDEVLALLDYLANHDLMTSARDMAKEALEAEKKKTAPQPPELLHPGDARHIFKVRCKNDHVTYFDKRRVCVMKSGQVLRSQKHDVKKLSELLLKCETCGQEMAVLVDCEGYK